MLRLVLNGSLHLFADERILLEYSSVLRRAKFSKIKPEADVVLEQISSRARRVVPEPIKAKIPDFDDLPFLEVARTAGVEAIVTGNKRHFPARAYGGVKVFSPKELLDNLAESV